MTDVATFAEHLTACRGNIAKACASYKRERNWHRAAGEAGWYDAWESGLADEVEAAVRAYPYPAGAR